MALKNDNFDDNSIDTTFWDKIEVGTGAVTEQNQRLECNAPAAADMAGLVTKDAHNLTACDIKVDVANDSCESQELFICLTKTTNSNPYFEANWYRIMKYNPTDKCIVQRRINGGSVTALYNAAWTGSAGSLRIVIANGTITFYEEAKQRASENYALSSYNCYVYIHARGNTGYLGMDFFDNFLGSSVALGRSQGYIIG